MSFEENLVERVRQNDLLYNLSSENYKNIILKDKVWRDISISLGVPVDTCKKRWRTLRDSYKRLKHRLELPTGSAEENARLLRWKYFSLLRFLDDIPCTRQTENFEVVLANSSSTDTADVLSENATPPHTTPPYSIPLDIPLEEPSVKKRRNNQQIPKKFRKLLNVTEESLNELRSAIKDQQTNSNNSTLHLMLGLSNRIQRSGLTEEELAEVEMCTIEFVFSKIKEIKNKRAEN